MKKEEQSPRRKKLFYSPKPAFDFIGDGDADAIENLSSSYRDFIDAGKTERECVENARALAEQWGFKPYERGMTLKAGDKVFTADRGRNIVLAVIGKKPLSDGMRIMASHIDSPRLDLKPNPLYEEDGQALFKTHYYGGVKKYHWLAAPLELRGIVTPKNGEPVEIQVGADPYDPVLVITDLLPHLSGDIGKKTIAEGFGGESLNALAGIKPDPEEGDNRVKLAVLSWLNEKYGIVEEDFLTAELSLVPAMNARDVGFDRSMIGAYGHDDRCCSFAGLQAILETESPQYTAVCVLADKEEIGSEGVSGMKSRHFDAFIGDMCKAQNVDLDHCYSNSFCLSGDVCNAYDPNFPEVHDKRNNARIGGGAGVFMIPISGVAAQVVPPGRAVHAGDEVVADLAFFVAFVVEAEERGFVAVSREEGREVAAWVVEGKTHVGKPDHAVVVGVHAGEHRGAAGGAGGAATVVVAEQRGLARERHQVRRVHRVTVGLGVAARVMGVDVNEVGAFHGFSFFMSRRIGAPCEPSVSGGCCRPRGFRCP
ncbi:MAG: hypothetical protein FWF96_03270 [Kiritimatiellaeota bacterium]|nr:hypothetical protein [Kiritimatiellota bacterium]